MTTAGEGLDRWGHAQLSNLYRLFVLSMMMFDGRKSDDILALAGTSVSSLCPCTAEATYLEVDGELVRRPEGQRPDAELDALVSRLDGHGGDLVLTGRTWHRALVLSGFRGVVGCLVVRADVEPSVDELFLLRVLGQQTGAALTSSALLLKEHEQRLALRRANDERAAVDEELTATVSRLRQQTRVHEVLTGVSATGAGEPGIAHALSELTSLPVVIEDQFGNLRAWAGPGRPDHHSKPSARQREDLLRRAARLTHPLRDKERLVSLVKPRHDVLGVIALVDPHKRAGDHEIFALEYGTTVLALELAHQRSLAEVVLRLHRDLVDDLVAGTDDESAYARADAVGHDLRGPHHVVVLQWQGVPNDDSAAGAVARAVGGLGLKALCSRRSGRVVLLVYGRPDNAALYRAVSTELASALGAIGVGGRCATPAEFPRSFAEALRALHIRQTSRSPHGLTAFEQLGLYRILDTGESRDEIISFVREWLGDLLDYDSHKNSDLVRTLSQFLECGGNYDKTAAALLIHRNTLRYRLSRIKEITGLDLSDVEDRLNLHVATRAWQVLEGADQGDIG